jgi:opacity protein-like surface antigen
MHKIILLILLFVIFNSNLDAQNKLKKSNSGILLMGGFGATIPISADEFRDTFYVGANYKLSGGYIFGKYLGFRIDLQVGRYKRLSNYDVQFSELGANGVLWITSASIQLVTGVFKRCECLQPYSFIGASMFHVDIYKNVSGVDVNGSETNFGGALGVGLSYRLPYAFRIGLEAQLNMMANDGFINAFFPISLNIMYINN